MQLGDIDLWTAGCTPVSCLIGLAVLTTAWNEKRDTRRRTLLRDVRLKGDTLGEGEGCGKPLCSGGTTRNERGEKGGGGVWAGSEGRRCLGNLLALTLTSGRLL